MAANLPEQYTERHVLGIDAEFASCCSHPHALLSLSMVVGCNKRIALHRIESFVSYRSLPQGSCPPLFASKLASESYTQGVWYSWPTVAAPFWYLTRTRFSQSQSAATGSDELIRRFAGEAPNATCPSGRMR